MKYKTDMERQKLHNLLYKWNLTYSDSQNLRVEWRLPGAVGMGKQRNVGQRVQISAMQVEEILEIECTAWGLQLTILYYILEIF